MGVAETNHAREHVLSYCKGRGLDIGCGQEKIAPGAIGLDYATESGVATSPATAASMFGPWEITLPHVPLEQIDYIYSSHLLEDYGDIEPPLRAWTTALRPGGYLILYLPIEEVYQEHCRRAGTIPNCNHHQRWRGAEDFIEHVPSWFTARMEVIEWRDRVGVYSFYIVFQKTKEAVK